MNIDKKMIRRRALELIVGNGRGVAARLGNEFGISRQVANGYLQALARDGLVEAEGTTRSRVYRLKMLLGVERRYVREGLQEDLVWRDQIAPLVATFASNVRDIWHYGSTEMINNAIDHSGALEVQVDVRQTALFTEIVVADEGEGIFLKIQRALNLFDPREAILELAKGKLTTAPKHHSGEGIFFTSRVMDEFEIESHHLRFSHVPQRADRIAEQVSDTPGTRVRMRLDNESTRVLMSVFNEYTDSGEYAFDRTIVPLRLAQHEGEKLVSRSQAKRIANRFERFKRVELDFAEIEEIGQAFADEMFRVFATAHPEIRITPLNSSLAVAKMIRRAVDAAENKT
jgi:anti-sigma regulatory factor (Ser/Thr protein kinase)